MPDKDIVVQSPQSLIDDSIVPVKIVQQRQKAIWELMAGAMENGTDYGVTPGCGTKPSLLKSGSEKILSMFQLAVEPTVEDLCPLGGGPYDEYRIRVYVHLRSKGVFAGKGVGEASSWEEKYKWRRAVTDSEYAYMESINPELVRIKFGRDYKSKQEYKIKQVRVPTADIANTIVKMGKKRAQIDATLTATAASAIFSQDLEDMPEEVAAEIMEGQEATARQKADRPTRAKRKVNPESEASKEPEKPRDPDCITQEQVTYLYTIASKCKLSHQDVIDELKANFKDKSGNPVDSTRKILIKDYQKVLDAIDVKFHHHAPAPPADAQEEPGANG